MAPNGEIPKVETPVKGTYHTAARHVTHVGKPTEADVQRQQHVFRKKISGDTATGLACPTLLEGPNDVYVYMRSPIKPWRPSHERVGFTF